MTYDSATDTWTDADGNIVSEDDIPPTDLSEYPGLYILGEAVEGADQIEQLNGTITVEVAN